MIEFFRKFSVFSWKRSQIIYFLNFVFYLINILPASPNLLDFSEKKKESNKSKLEEKNLFISNLNWKKYSEKNKKSIIHWEKLHEIEYKNKVLKNNIREKNKKLIIKSINSHNRSIIINNEITGPDIGWLVPPGLKWNTKYSLDSSVRGHNRRKEGEPFLGWNGGDAVGQFYYHPLHSNSYSFGLNLGMRSVYQGSAGGGTTPVGEGISMGFRIDKSLSNNSGIAFGAEQLIHFDGLTDTGRDIYLTASKGWWSRESKSFPINVATFGFATGKMAEGNIKGLCSNLLGGSGTEVFHQRSLCWAPVFSLARVHNSKLSTFFEYNSKWFLVGSSIAPFDEIPLRGTFAVQLSDHIENYKLNDFDNLKWVFRLSLGF